MDIPSHDLLYKVITNKDLIFTCITKIRFSIYDTVSDFVMRAISLHEMIAVAPPYYHTV